MKGGFFPLQSLLFELQWQKRKKPRLLQELLCQPTGTPPRGSWVIVSCSTTAAFWELLTQWCNAYLIYTPQESTWLPVYIWALDVFAHVSFYSHFIWCIVAAGSNVKGASVAVIHILLVLLVFAACFVVNSHPIFKMRQTADFSVQSDCKEWYFFFF